VGSCRFLRAALRWYGGVLAAGVRGCARWSECEDDWFPDDPLLSR
jgi:hypothetical protein